MYSYNVKQIQSVLKLQINTRLLIIMKINIKESAWFVLTSKNCKMLRYDLGLVVYK